MSKKMIKNIIVLGLITLLMGGLIAGTYALTNPIIEKNKNRALENVAKEFFEGSNVFFKLENSSTAGEKLDSETFKGLTKEEKQDLKDFLFVYNNNEYLGIVVTGAKSNAHGGITLAVVISPSGNILGIKAIDFAQTPGIGDAALEKYVAAFKNVPLDHKIDAASGATNSSNTLNDIISTIANAYNAHADKIVLLTGAVSDPLAEAFGTYTKEKDNDFVPTANVLERYIITGDKASGYSYVASASHSFDSGHGDVSGEVKLEIFADATNKVVYYEILVYKHTSGGFKDRIVSYLDKLVGTNLENIESFIAENKGTYAGSSETGAHVIDVILMAINELQDPLKAVFGNYTTVKDSAFAATGTISERYVITGDKASGSSFVGSKSHSFTHEGGQTVQGEVKVEFFLDEEGVVLSYKILVYEHTSGNFKNRVIDYLNKLVGENILDVEAFIVANTEIVAGSTQTTNNVINLVLRDLRVAFMDNHPLYGVYGEFEKVLSGTSTEGNAVISVNTITGSKADGESFVGSASHSFQHQGGQTVEGEVKVEFYVDASGKVLAYDVLVYEHTGGTFKQRVIDYLDAFVGTDVNDIEQFIVDNKAIYAGSTETGLNVIEEILMGINEVIKR